MQMTTDWTVFPDGEPGELIELIVWRTAADGRWEYHPDHNGRLFATDTAAWRYAVEQGLARKDTAQPPPAPADPAETAQQGWAKAVARYNDPARPLPPRARHQLRADIVRLDQQRRRTA